MRDPYFFGYGSLVNIHTHMYGETSKARLSGWQRLWQMTPHRDVPYLSVAPKEGVAIDGLIAHVPGGDWAQLDLRETGYDRVGGLQVEHGRTDAPEIATYVVPTPAPEVELPAGKILLSYLDVVIQGFLHQFGRKGARHFFDTTAGWDFPIDNDRAAPKYPRHQRLSAEETAIVDAELARLGLRV